MDEARTRLVRAAIGTWRDGLVNLSRSNRLLNFRPRKTSAVEIVDTESAKVVSALAAGQQFSFRGPAVEMQKSTGDHEAEPPPAPGRGRKKIGELRTATGGRDLAGALRNLLRRSQSEYLDRGLHILYLAIGRLEWTDETGSSNSSPLLLVPVELMSNGPRQLPYLQSAEDDAVLNPALALKLTEFDIVLPTLKDLDDVEPGHVLDQVRSAVSGRRGWRVEDAAVLSYFTFAKEAMYRDLLDNEDRIAGHPGIQALAAGGGGGSGEAGFDFEELADKDIDELAPADSTSLVLDADSSQRASIAAAVEGRSFVMDGPPGTGKSQTIANMIGALLHAGRTVLFVSEKAAALDVVRNRLTGVGLGAFLLELHSSKATRKEVAAELGRALDSKPVAPGGMSAVDVDQLRRRQRELNRYAAAMNDRRGPLGESVHTVIGWTADLADVPAAPATGRPVDGLTPALLGEIRRLARSLSEAWRPALQGSSYVWRDIREPRAMTSRLQAASRAVDDLDELMGAHREVATAFGMEHLGRADALAALLEHQAARPSGVPDQWLVAPTGDETSEALEHLQTHLDTICRQQEATTAAAGVPWSDLPGPQHLAALDLTRFDGLQPAPLPVDDLTVPVMDGVLARLATDRERLGAGREALDGVAALLGLPAVRTFSDAEKLLSVASTAAEPDRPEPGWFSEAGHAIGVAALGHLTSIVRRLDEAEAEARRYYDDSALEADAVGLEERFRTRHTGLRRLSAAYRRDKATVVGFTRGTVGPARAQLHLPLLIGWQQAVAALHAAAPDHARDLGSFYAGRTTDTDRVARVLAHAEQVTRTAQGLQQHPQDELRGVAQQLGRQTTPAPALLEATRVAATSLHDWRAALGQVSDVRFPPRLQVGTIAAAQRWVDVNQTVVSMARAAVVELDRVTGRQWSVRDTRRILGLRRTVDEAAAALDAEAGRYSALFGPLFAGERTDLDRVHGAAAWAQTLRTLVGGPLTATQTAALAHSREPGGLRPVVSRWHAARAAVIEAFAPTRHAELATELDDAHDARELLSALLEDSSGQDEWSAYRESRDELARLGLGEAVDFCVREQMPGHQVPAVVEKALLTEWVDHHLSTDTALRMVRAQSRDGAVEDFRELDLRVITGAVGRIIDTCNERRPRLMTDQAATIRREAEKKRKHMPVRELVDRSRDVTRAIKPCFMMSPLAVSQFLPPDLDFDVVIFDEASQVAPMDAINCVYRGRALITAGDRKQLPPTSFFAAAGDDGDEWVDEADDAKDFESILDLAKSSGAYRSLTLRWHYRSRHEALIAFSNASFYDGGLITFPGAEHQGPDVGVELIPVKGVYRRGSTRDNPVEAQKVAELVLHHFDTRPGRSVGVVTFSEAQATTIEAAVEEARRDRPDLDDHFTEDRLDGFFVKSLESVQGDERDVMIFSIGYGPDENGKTTMNFGPLNRAGGWRRLNVAVTRARYRNEIVASLGAGDITANNEGLRHFRRYLDFAERGLPALALDTSTGGDAESPFEESVIRTVRSWGYDVTPQVGAAGYRIDMAVHHPDRPGVFVLAVECDGAQYHSSRVARDRDRLRDQVLVGLGWTMHRIWGTAWYRDRPGAERRLIEAIETAVQAPVRGLLGGAVPAARGRVVAVDLEPVEFSDVPDWAVPYRPAEIGRRPRWTELHDPAIRPAMCDAIVIIVAEEGPVHIDTVHQRFRQAWDIGQIGSRIRGNIEAAVQAADVVQDGDYLRVRRGERASVRTPVDRCSRAVDRIHPAELEAAVLTLIRDVGGMGQDEVMLRVSRLFGWNRRGPDITRTLSVIVEGLIGTSRLVRAGDDLRVAED